VQEFVDGSPGLIDDTLQAVYLADVMIIPTEELNRGSAICKEPAHL
jgi:hypothetical protein